MNAFSRRCTFVWVPHKPNVSFCFEMSKMFPELLALTTAVCTLFPNAAVGVTIHEVNIGETAKLPCPSNDRNHRFQYWQLVNDDIIGPWNNWKGHKMKYEVTTGELTIKEVSPEETGLYKCVSKALTGPSLHVETVQLLVKRDWEEAYEDDAVVNTYRGLIAFFCFLILFLLGVLAFIIARRKRSRGNLEENDDSPDELLTRSRGTYRPTTTSYFPSSDRKKKVPSNEALVGDTVETDLKTSFSLPDYG